LFVAGGFEFSVAFLSGVSFGCCMFLEDWKKDEMQHEVAVGP